MKQIVSSVSIFCAFVVNGAHASLSQHSSKPEPIASYCVSLIEQKYHQLCIPTTTPIKPVAMLKYYQYTDRHTLLYESCLPDKQIWRNAKDIGPKNDLEHSARLLNVYLYDADKSVHSQQGDEDGVGTRYRGFMLGNNQRVADVVVDGPNKQGFIFYGLCIHDVDVPNVELLFLPQRSENRQMPQECGPGQWMSVVLTYDQTFNNTVLHTLALDPEANRVALSLNNKAQGLENHTLEIYDVVPAPLRLDGSDYEQKALFTLVGKGVLAAATNKVTFFTSTRLGGLIGTGILTFFEINGDGSISSHQVQNDICFKDFTVHRKLASADKDNMRFAVLSKAGDVYYGSYSFSKKSVNVLFLRTVPIVASIQNFFYEDNELRFVYRSEDAEQVDDNGHFPKITKMEVYTTSDVVHEQTYCNDNRYKC